MAQQMITLIQCYEDCDIFIGGNNIEWLGYAKETTFGQMIDLAMEHKCCVLTKNGGGKWYLKGLHKTYEEAKEKAEQNVGNYPRIKVWLIQL